MKCCATQQSDLVKYPGWVMEQKHKSRLMSEFTSMLLGKPVHVLDIPDEYRYMDAELVEMLERSVGGVLQLD